METLLTLTLSGSALALVLLALRYLLLRRMPSTLYYYAWLLVLLRFALPLPGLVPAGAAAEPARPAPAPQFHAYSPEPADFAALPVLPAAAPSGSAEAEAEEEPAPETAPAAEATPASKTPTLPRIDWRAPRLWLGVWAGGAALSFLFTLFAYLRFTGSLRRSLGKPDRFTRAVYADIPGRKPALYVSSDVRTPLMYGFFSPKIVLPARAYDEELLGNILLHELTHYRRFDTLYKWLAAAVLATQWFNPLSYLIRRELGRACELSCDEMLLRRMTRGEKQSYGNTLLSMAASQALPAGVVATTFATEKRDLKERLEQIMHYKRNGARLLATLLALALLAGCGFAAGPAAKPAETKKPEAPADAVVVTNVDELLAAIAPNATIYLQAGDYELSTAANYGEDTHSSYYSWNGVSGEPDRPNSELVISRVDGLTLLGEGADKTTVSAVPRYANVIRFIGCRDLTVSGLTAGHTTEPGFCTGGVLRLENCSGSLIDACNLYGCGILGVWADGCSDLTVQGCRIYECSYGAVSVGHCRNVRVEDCDIDSHGTRAGQGAALDLLAASYSEDFTVYNNRIYNNHANFLLNIQYTKGAYFLSNEVHDNHIDSAVFNFEQYPAVVDGCAFRDNEFRFWLPDRRLSPVSISGTLLDDAALENMELRDLDPAEAIPPAPTGVPENVRPGGEITVTDVDDFLKAIGPDRTIVLDGELFDLSTAANYGAVGGEYYYWNSGYDGPELVIHDVSGLTIHPKAAYAEATTLAAVPRYANVLNFRDCDNLQLVGFTAGHTTEPGSCSGGVLNFQNCHDVMLEGMRLYGCGILGVQAAQCTSLAIRRTEIFECSQGAGQFFQCDGIQFLDCDIHDVPSPAFSFRECGDKLWNGEAFSGLDGMYDVAEDGTLSIFERPREEVLEYHGAVEDLVNPFAAEPAFSYPANGAEQRFARAVQQAIADGDWEALADRIAFPIQFFDETYSYVIHDRDEFLDMVPQDDFEGVVFPDAFRERIGNASIEEYGSCVFGVTCLDHLIAFAGFGNDNTENDYRIRAISISTPLWPGRGESDPVLVVPPTPEP